MLPESRPSPWLNHIITLAITMSGVVYSAASRDADLRHVQTTQEAHERRMAELERRANNSDVTTATTKAEFAYLREGMTELRLGMDELRDEIRAALGVRRAAR